MIDYLVLVNKLNPLPPDWEDNLKTVHFTNTVGDDVEVEQRAYDAYLKRRLGHRNIRMTVNRLEKVCFLMQEELSCL